MEFIKTDINGLYLIKPKVLEDERGKFTKTFHLDTLKAKGLPANFQEGYYTISQKDVLRGMHFQTPPHDHEKLVYVPKGAILDVVLDIRKDSPSYGKYVSQHLNESNGYMFYIPKGCAHGFLSLENDTNVTYSQTSMYAPHNDGGINCHSFGFDWGIQNPIISERDLSFNHFSDFITPFKENSKMKVIVTGSTGFVAKALIKSLINKNHEVHAIIRSTSNTDGIPEGTKFFIDNGNSQALVDYFKKVKPDGIAHLASWVLNEHTADDIETIITSNIAFGTRLLEASVQSSTKWFINTGTFWQHFNNETYNPVNLYAATKQAFEDIAKFYYETKKLNFVTIKLNDTFGPGDTRKKIFNLWQNLVQSGGELGMSPGEQIIDISYIDDIIEAYILLITQLQEDLDYTNRGNVYSISSSERMSLQNLAKVYENSTEETLNIIWGKRPYRDREVMLPWNNGVPVPGWKQNTSLKDAIQKVKGTNK